MPQSRSKEQASATRDKINETVETIAQIKNTAEKTVATTEAMAEKSLSAREQITAMSVQNTIDRKNMVR